MTLTGVVNAWKSSGVPHTTLADGRIASRFFIVKRAAREEKRAAAHKTGVSHGFHSAVHTQQTIAAPAVRKGVMESAVRNTP